MSSDQPAAALTNPGSAAATGGATALEFTVLERSVVAELTGSRTPDLALLVGSVFADLAPRPVSGREPDLVLDTDRGDAALLEELGQELCRRAIHLRRHDLLMLHACGVSDPRTGATVGLVGRSGAGKSTAVSVLGRRWGYVTDEVLAVDDDGRVVPCPKPVSTVVPGEASKRQVRGSDLGLGPTPEGTRLVGLLLLDRRPDAEVAVDDVPTIDALSTLAPQISYLASRPRPLHRIAQTLHAVGGLRRVSYEEADDLVPVVGALLEGRVP